MKSANDIKKEQFEKLVLTRFNIYNGLFLNLPYDKESGVGEMLPLLSSKVQKGISEELTPKSILNEFFEEQGSYASEKDQIDFMFKVIQFIERQVVLFDSIEDAAFPDISSKSDRPRLHSFLLGAPSEDQRKVAIDQLQKMSTRIVLTAHPTQFYQPAVLNIISDIGSSVRANEIDDINNSLQQLGLTSLLNAKKPTPLDEAKNIIYYLRNVYYDAIGELYSQVKNDVNQFEEFENDKLIKLGFWPGGDRDGNPFVTSEVTLQVADELRVTLMKCYYNEVKKLQRKITFKNIDSKLEDLRKTFYKAMFQDDYIISYDNLYEKLLGIRELLISDYHGLFLSEFESFVDKVRIFKMHFAALDIRQDHSVHEQLMTEVLKHNNSIESELSEYSSADLKELLLKKDFDLMPEAFSEELLSDTVKNIANLPELQRRNGKEGCERYIISNSEDIFSVLFVFSFMKWTVKNFEDIHFDIVPLFETMDGMNNSEKVMRELFQTEEYMAHVKRRGNVQTIMLGYSDGTKDGGFLKANWNIYRTKEILSQVCEEFGVSVVFFDGRGGPPARGGGKTHRFYAAQSDLIANNEIQLTIQGQTISSTYGTSEQFTYNIKELISASLNNAVKGDYNSISEEHRTLLTELAEASFEKYDSLKKHPKFLDYLEKKSTLKYYSKANIGSRPAKRRGDKKLTLSDLRAISFVGSWSQLKQNIPGYYGLGSAISELKNNGRIEEIKDLFQNVPIFRALVLNSMMSLSKTNFSLTSYLKEDEEFSEFWKELKNEYTLSKSLLLELAGYSELMEEEVFSKQSIKVRENLVLPLLVIQQYALQKVNDSNEFKTLYEKLVTRSLYGNINASRNSA